MKKELTTLFIGFYDYSYGYGAYIFENKHFRMVDIDNELYDLLNDIGCSLQFNNEFKLTREELNHYYIDRCNQVEKVNNAIKLIKNLFETYKNVVICDDGIYTYFDKSMDEVLL